VAAVVAGLVTVALILRFGPSLLFTLALAAPRTEISRRPPPRGLGRA
jgi:hypothetical protein